MVNSDNKSFLAEVRACVWDDVKSAVRSRLRLFVEAVISFGTGYTLLALYGSQDAAFDFAIEKAWAVPIGLVFLFLIHLLWSWATAPRRVYYEQQQTIRSLLAESDRLREQAGNESEKPDLRIEYEPEKHFTRHPNGSVQIRLLLKNVGPVEAKTVRVRMESLVPTSNKKNAQPYSSQFNACRLQVVRQEPGFSLQSNGDSAEVLVMHAEKGEEFYWVDALGDDEQPTAFRTPRARYEITIVATAKNGGGASRRFFAYPRRSGELGFKVS